MQLQHLAASLLLTACCNISVNTIVLILRRYEYGILCVVLFLRNIYGKFFFLQTDNANSPRSGAAEQLLQLDDMSMTLRELNLTSGAKIVLDVRVYNALSKNL